MRGLRIPGGWLPDASHPERYEMGVDPLIRCGAMEAACVESTVADGDEFGTLVQQCNAKHYIGKRIRLSALVLSQDVESWAGLWLRIDGSGVLGVLGYDNMEDRPIIGCNDWTTHSIVLDVPAESETLFFGISLYGRGKVWMAGVKLREVGLDVPTTNQVEAHQWPDGPSNLDFAE